jgi:hypothetical protein
MSIRIASGTRGCCRSKTGVHLNGIARSASSLTVTSSAGRVIEWNLDRVPIAKRMSCPALGFYLSPECSLVQCSTPSADAA